MKVMSRMIRRRKYASRIMMISIGLMLTDEWFDWYDQQYDQAINILTIDY